MGHFTSGESRTEMRPEKFHGITREKAGCGPLRIAQDVAMGISEQIATQIVDRQPTQSLALPWKS